jgi:hypothetical protein
MTLPAVGAFHPENTAQQGGFLRIAHRSVPCVYSAKVTFLKVQETDTDQVNSEWLLAISN